MKNSQDTSKNTRNSSKKSEHPLDKGVNPNVKRKPSQIVKWVYRPLKSTIVVCACGNKYISTHEGQTTCVFCMRKDLRR